MPVACSRHGALRHGPVERDEPGVAGRGQCEQHVDVEEPPHSAFVLA